MPATVILNPYSNRWEAGKQRPAVEAALQAAGVDFALRETTAPRHATELVRQAIETGNTPIIAAGGDGLYGEVVNGMMQTDYRGPLGIIPLGTCNDLPDMLDIPRDLNAAAQTIAAGHTRRIDLGRVNDHYFDNNSAVGLEAVISVKNAELTWARGTFRYLLAAAIIIMRRPVWHMTLEWEDGHYQGPVVLVSVGNTSRTGCVYFMTPEAQPDSGKLDFIFGVGPISRLRMFRLLPMALKGTQIEQPEVQMHRTSFLRITLSPGTPIQADGEIIATDATEIYYEVLPGIIDVLVPAP